MEISIQEKISGLKNIVEALYEDFEGVDEFLSGAGYDEDYMRVLLYQEIDLTPEDTLSLYQDIVNNLFYNFSDTVEYVYGMGYIQDDFLRMGIDWDCF